MKTKYLKTVRLFFIRRLRFEDATSVVLKVSILGPYDEI